MKKFQELRRRVSGAPPETESDGYGYQTLDPDSREIRLLHLQPALTWKSEIVCSLVHVTLEDVYVGNDKPPKYDALSYTWGDPKTTRSIKLGDKSDAIEVQVTKNLESALRHLRDGFRTRILWIDALCINQGDLAERSSQVQIMKTIFRRAQSVIAWIGEASVGEKSQYAMELLSRLCGLSVADQALFLQNAWQKKLGSGFDDWRPVFRLLNRPYWRRVWVVQELATPYASSYPTDSDDSSDVNTSQGFEIRCGQRTIPGHTFRLLWPLLKMGQWDRSYDEMKSKEPFKTLAEAEPAALEMMDLTNSFGLSQGRGIDLTYLLNRTKTFKSTDPRDKIYALLGLAPAEQRRLVPDYTQPVQAVFAHAVMHLMLESKSLEILTGARATSQLTQKAFPSWVPDTCVGADIISSNTWRSRIRRNLFFPSGKLLAQVSFSTDMKQLTVQGVMIDTIKSTCGPFGQSQTDNITAEADSKSPTGDHLLDQVLRRHSSQQDILWRTLTLDLDHADEDMAQVPSPGEIRLGFDGMMARAGLRQVTVSESLLERLSKVTIASDDPDGARTPPEERENRLVYKCLQHIREATTDRVWITGETNDYVGLGPREAQAGDLVVVLFGGPACFVLRPQDSYFLLIGDAYIDGIMKAELDLGAEEGRDFVLI